MLKWLSIQATRCSNAHRVFRARGQSQFGRPHPGHSRQLRCEGWVGSKGASKADLGPAYSCF